MKKVLKEIKYILFNLIDKLLEKQYSFNIVNSEGTLLKLLQEKNSISRFGDGEFSIIFGCSLPFQKYDKNLSEKLKYILKKNDSDQCLIAIPYVFTNKDIFTKKSKMFWTNYLIKNRVRINNITNNSRTYYDSQCTRIYINRLNKDESINYFNIWKKIWNNASLLIVEGEYSKLGVGNNLFNNCKTINRIICPSINAFDCYDKIYDAINKRKNDFDLVLIALGPTATVLSYELSKNGIQAIDTGNLDMEFEWFIRNVDNPVAIDGKYSHETVGCSINNSANTMDYNNQIVDVIK